jgi:hypothetical protein
MAAITIAVVFIKTLILVGGEVEALPLRYREPRADGPTEF